MNYMLRERIDEYKKALRNGCLVVGQRNSGKTLALAEIYMEDNNAVVIVPQQTAKNTILEYINEKYPQANKTHPLIMIGGTERTIENIRLLDKNFYKVYIDEYDINQYKGPYHGAISTFKHPIVVF